jgi:acyl-CoA thioesterase FadM
MFTYAMTVQLHHADAYGILFFANQFVFCHDVFQAWMSSEGLALAKNRQSARFVAVVVHAESDYLAKTELGDQLEIRLANISIGTTSFTNGFTFINQHGTEVGRARAVMVTIDPVSSQKIPIPIELREALEGLR